MKKLVNILMLCVLLMYSSYGGTNISPSTSYTDVSNTIIASSSGDTVMVPAGTATWSDRLIITKGINLIGAGPKNTIITIAVDIAIQFHPTDTSLNEAFRLSRFMIDFDNHQYGIDIENDTTAYALTNIRIDHNVFTNCGSPVLELSGPIWGVMDNNYMYGLPHIDIYGQNSYGDWDDMTFTQGDGHFFFIEDNTITTIGVATTGGHGGRYVWRYNTFIHNNPASGPQPWFDMHGNQPPTVPAGFRGGAIYGNKITATYYKSACMVDDRGGQALVFFNRLDGFQGPWTKMREEYTDPVGYSMHVTNTYYWNNRAETSLLTPYIAQNDGDTPIAINANFWAHDILFDGTSGMGCGLLANRPITCTKGVGYWATDQDCTVVDDSHIGRTPSSPIKGTLYIATDTDVWTEYYTPYTYPHPLRNENIIPNRTLLRNGKILIRNGLILIMTVNENNHNLIYKISGGISLLLLLVYLKIKRK